MEEGVTMNTLSEHNLHTSVHLVPIVIKPGAIEPAATLATPLLGTWINTNPAVRDIVKMVIASHRGALTVEALGTLNNEPCDWGAATGIAYASSLGSSPAIAFSAQYTFRSSHVILIGHLQGKRLLVETFTQFTDGSNRASLYSVDTLSR